MAEGIDIFNRYSYVDCDAETERLSSKRVLYFF